MFRFQVVHSSYTISYTFFSAPPNNQTSETQSEEADNTEEQEPASNAQIREMDSIVSAMEADVTTGCDFFTRSSGMFFLCL